MSLINNPDIKPTQATITKKVKKVLLYGNFGDAGLCDDKVVIFSSITFIDALTHIHIILGAEILYDSLLIVSI